MGHGLPIAVTLAFAAMLGGCAETTAPGGQAVALDVRAAIARGDMHSPKAAAVALASLDGAPEPLAARFRQHLAGEATGRQISMTDPAAAHYFLRGYLDAYHGESGTSVHYVWDLFDSSKQRVKRFEESFDIPASEGIDPWAGVDDTVLASMAARSADDIALALSGTPEATAFPALAPGQNAAAALSNSSQAVN